LFTFQQSLQLPCIFVFWVTQEKKNPKYEGEQTLNYTFNETKGISHIDSLIG